MRKAKSVRKKVRAKRANSRSQGKGTKTSQPPELKHIPWSSVELETLNPLLQRQLMVGHQVMLARVILEKSLCGSASQPSQ